MSKFPGYPELHHPTCSSCKAFCCSRKFGYSSISLTDHDMRNKPLMELLRRDKLLTKVRSSDGGVGMRIGNEEREECLYMSDGRCTIYNIRPVACRAFFCTTHVSPLSRLTQRPQNAEWVAFMTSQGFDLEDRYAAAYKGHAPLVKDMRESSLSFRIEMRQFSSGRKLRFDSLVMRRRGEERRGKIALVTLQQALEERLLPHEQVRYLRVVGRALSRIEDYESYVRFETSFRKKHSARTLRRKRRAALEPVVYSGFVRRGAAKRRRYVKRKGRKIWRVVKPSDASWMWSEDKLAVALADAESAIRQEAKEQSTEYYRKKINANDTWFL